MKRLGEPVKRIYGMMQSNSIEVFLAILCLFAGLPILLNPMVFAPASILALLPFSIVFLWAAALVLGGLLDIVGIMFGNVYARRAGLAMLASGAFVMGVTILVLTGNTRIFAAGLYFIFSWSTGARYTFLGKSLKMRRKRWEKRIKG